MLGLDELEKLSRFAAGDLPHQEAEQLKAELGRRPDLAEALEQLSRLEAAAQALPQSLPADELDTLIERVPRGRHVVPSTRLGIAAAAALALVASAAAVWFGLAREPRPRLVALSGSVTLNGLALPAPSEPLALPPGAVIHCGSASASIIETREARLLLARESELALSAERPAVFGLSKGTLAASGRQIHLAAGSTRVDLTGRGVLSWEPEEDLVRVTDAMEQNKEWGFKSLRLPLAATAVAAAGVTVLVLEGKAMVTSDAARPVEVAAGQKWTTSSPKPTAITAPTALVATAEPAARRPEQSVSGARPQVDDRSLRGLSRDQLVAEVVRLRAQNSSLAERNQEIQRKLEQADPKEQATKENYYRQDPADLRAMAERGEMRLHPPPTLDGHSIYDPRVASDLGLTPEEEAKIREIYDRSTKTIREGLISLYVEIGGDANVGNALDSFALSQELQSKTVDRNAAVRTAIRERGGLEQPADPNQGSALLRMYRLFYREEDRLIAALDALLGPARAEEFLNHPNASHNTWSTTTRSTPPRP